MCYITYQTCIKCKSSSKFLRDIVDLGTKDCYLVHCLFNEFLIVTYSLVNIAHVVGDFLDFVLAYGVVGGISLGADVVYLYCEFVHLLLELFLLLGVLCDPLVYLCL